METAKLDIQWLMYGEQITKQSRILDSRYWIQDSLSVELGNPDCIVSGIQDSLSCIPESEAQGSRFSKHQRAKISRIPESRFPYTTHKVSGQRVRLSFKFTLLTFQFISCIVLVLFNFRTDGTKAVCLTGGCLTLSSSSRMFQEGKMNFLSFICRIFFLPVC